MQFLFFSVISLQKDIEFLTEIFYMLHFTSFRFNLSNKGNIKMDYSWQVFMENMAPSLTRAVTFMSEGERPESRIDVVDASYVPFTISPEYGSIAAGKKQRITVKFSPLDVNTYEGRLICT